MNWRETEIPQSEQRTLPPVPFYVPVWAQYNSADNADRTLRAWRERGPNGEARWRSWPEPDFSTLPIKLKSTRAIGVGSATAVYLVEPETDQEASEGNSAQTVLKVELLVQEDGPGKSSDGVFSPWAALGMGEARSHFTGAEAAQERKETHLAIREKVVSAGILAVELRNTYIFQTKPIERYGKEPMRLPLYAEEWDHPGPGKMMGEDEEALERLYRSPEGREKLRRFGETLLRWCEEGFVYDVATRKDGAIIIPTTTEKELPFPKNMFLTDDGRMVAVDFNMALDMTRDAWWDRLPGGFFDRENIQFTASNGRTSPRWGAIYALREMSSDVNREIELQRGLSVEQRDDLYERREFFIMQLGLAIKMLDKVREYEEKEVIKSE